MIKKTLSVRNVLQQKYQTVAFTGAWRDAFGRPERRGVWVIFGRTGQGKSMFCMQLVRAFADMKLKTAYFSWEEGFGLTFQNAIRVAGWQEVSRLIVVEDKFIPFEQFAAWVNKHKRVKVFVFDSLQRWDIKKKDLMRLEATYPDRLFVFISHVKGNGQLDGAVAITAERNAFLKIYVEGFKALCKGRTSGDKGYYVIWDKGYNEYWGNNFK
ncbi:MAG: ATP-binding protein [Bacteroidales bacterium]